MALPINRHVSQNGIKIHYRVNLTLAPVVLSKFHFGPYSFNLNNQNLLFQCSPPQLISVNHFDRKQVCGTHMAILRIKVKLWLDYGGPIKIIEKKYEKATNIIGVRIYKGKPKKQR